MVLLLAGDVCVFVRRRLRVEKSRCPRRGSSAAAAVVMRCDDAGFRFSDVFSFLSLPPTTSLMRAIHARLDHTHTDTHIRTGVGAGGGPCININQFHLPTDPPHIHVL